MQDRKERRTWQWSGTRPSRWRSARSTSSSARAPSCGWARRGRWRWRPSPPAPSRSTSPSASAACPRGRVVEIFGPESSGKSTLAMHVVAEAQRNGGICAYIDAEHAMDPVYAAGHRGRHRRAAHHPARHGGAGARDRRHAHPLGCARRGGHRLGGRAHAPGRDRGRDGRHPRRPPGPPHEPGAAQAHRQPQQVEHHRHLHQPAAGEDRRDVRLARDHPRRAGAEVLLVGPARHPPHRVDQGRRRGGRAAAPG